MRSIDVYLRAYSDYQKVGCYENPYSPDTQLDECMEYYEYWVKIVEALTVNREVA